VVGLPLGLFFSFAQPAWFGNDESIHFARTWQIAGGDLTETKTPSGLSSEVPVEFLEDLRLVTISYATHWGPSFDRHSDILWHRADSGDTELFETWRSDISSPLPYLPAALAVAPLRVLGAPAYWQLVAGRLACLAAYLGLALAAVRFATRWRWAIAGLALFPPLIVQGATLGYDAVTLGGVFLLMGISAGLREVTDRRAGALLVLVGLLLALSKPPYYLLLFPIAVGLVVQRRVLPAIATLLPLGLGMFWSQVLSPDFVGSVKEFDRDVVYDAGLQWARLLDDPVGFGWHGLARTVLAIPTDHLPNWIPGVQLSAAAWIGLGVTMIVALGADDGPRTHGERFTALFATCIVCSAILVAEYLYFTEPSVAASRSAFELNKIQWRYLAPLLGPLLIASPRMPRISATTGLPLAVAGSISVAGSYVIALS